APLPCESWRAAPLRPAAGVVRPRAAATPARAAPIAAGATAAGATPAEAEAGETAAPARTPANIRCPAPSGPVAAPTAAGARPHPRRSDRSGRPRPRAGAGPAAAS